MSASQITAFNQSGIPSAEQVIVFSWIAKYFESICDESSAKNCLNISETLNQQLKEKDVK